MGRIEIPLFLWPQHYLTMFLSQSVYNLDVQNLGGMMTPTYIHLLIPLFIEETYFSTTFKSIYQGSQHNLQVVLSFLAER